MKEIKNFIDNNLPAAIIIFVFAATIFTVIVYACIAYYNSTRVYKKRSTWFDSASDVRRIV